MIEIFIGWCGRNRFLVMLAIVAAAFAAVGALKRVKLDAIPDLSDVQVIVFTEWPGRAPTLIEDQVTYPIVSTLAAAPKVKYARGQSFFGLSFVNVIFEDGTDMYWARSRVLEYMNQARSNLPDGVNPVLGPDATGVGWVFQYALVDRTGQQSLADLRTYQDWTLRYYLQNLPGVAEVASLGGHVDQYQVVLDPAKLQAKRVSTSKVIQAIRMSNNDVGGRLLEFGETEYMVRGLGYLEKIADLEQIVVNLGEDGVPVLLRDVAQVRRGPDLRRGLLEVNGEGEAVGGIVVMRYGENALKTIQAVKQKLKDIEPALPHGVEIEVGYDRSNLILRAIANLNKTLLEEMIIVSVVIAVFLLHFRSALVAIIALPLGVLLSFIPMQLLGISSNIMSLGGIAIAIGAMVDASIVFIENAHKWIQRWEEACQGNNTMTLRRFDGKRIALAEMTRTEVVIHSSQQVGKPLFFSLLIIAISFLPVFALEAQSGRLFKPLAFTKTFSMLFAAVLAVTLVPILIIWFVRGRIPDEVKNPVSRVLIWIYHPLANLALRFRWFVILGAVLVMAATWIPFSKIGSEFMPPLNEGSLLYMPTSPPGMSIEEAREVLQRQNRIIAAFPEVENVYGKIGRARTSTDPAPLSMVETTIMLKPESEWREGMTFEQIKKDLGAQLPFPGMPAIWWMPIQTRIEMLATGIRSQVGIKVMGPDLEKIGEISREIETLLKNAPNTATAFAERVTGGYYVDFKVKREAIARHGLHAENVLEVIETAIGGKNIDTTVEGRARFPINVRYAQDFRGELPSLRRVLVDTPAGYQIPIGDLADIQVTTGPPMVRNENGQLAGFVFVDTYDIDLGTYVERAKKLIRDQVKLPPGYYIEWGGQYQYMLKAREKLSWVIPLTLLIIFVLLYLNFQNVTESLIVFLSIPFALVGGIWLLWILDYNFSVAVAVGFIALAGVAAETGVVMIVYLDEAWHHVRQTIAKPSLQHLHESIIEGAVQRVRPKMMTVSTTILGLMPILWGHGTGADTMKRIAAPMVGGMISSTVLTLLIIPAVYFIWKRRELPQEALAGAQEKASKAHGVAKGVSRRPKALARLLLISGVFALLGALSLGVWKWISASSTHSADVEVATHQLKSLQVSVFSSDSQLKSGNNPIRVEIVDLSAGVPVAVESVSLDLEMRMPGMEMQNSAVLSPVDGQPGVYSGTIRPSMGGEWIGRIKIERNGTAEEQTFTTQVKS